MIDTSDADILLKFVTDQWQKLSAEGEQKRLLDSAISARTLFIALFGATDNFGAKVCEQAISVGISELNIEADKPEFKLQQSFWCSFCGEARSRSEIATGVGRAFICSSCIVRLNSTFDNNSSH